MDILAIIATFFILMILQSLVINGIHECFQGQKIKYQQGFKAQGNILYPIRAFLEKYISEYWQRPLWGCVRCMSSFWGSITFWGTVLPILGFYWFEVWVWVLDLFSLVYLNYYFYKKL